MHEEIITMKKNNILVLIRDFTKSSYHFINLKLMKKLKHFDQKKRLIKRRFLYYEMIMYY